ncbi:Nicotinamidase-related amidase [Cupriavidus sp. OV038]|jgi:nicotinamidase-related amidase|uniref:cysteine hydrolase n=1 Tax=unclassified Cupriavidus TaxID=2640874 RepID=UPI0008E44DE8|nr:MULTISPECIES: cysteine hydrolase [unclassified Cupriavidus]SFC62406.1 Nicotinamidase-related amidase [Cupriavidus sp. OV038]SFP40509.1 Nicotinamidase-related amidase [Cupriavidus sp. OV096]
MCNANPAYKDPAEPGLPSADLALDLARTALVVIDPQVDFMSPEGRSWGVVGESVTEQNLVPNLVRLFAAAKQAGICVAISPHYYFPHDHKWKVAGPAEMFQHAVGMFDRPGALTLEGFRDSGADFMPELKPYIEDGETIICSTHKLYGPQANDLVLQLRKQRVDQVILAGMAANLCVESHLRDLLEHGFEVAVVRDAVAGPKLPEGDGYHAALVNFRYIANALWDTDETLRRLAR